MAEDWTEKYRPRSLSEVVGNPQAAAAMKQWAESWARGKPTKRAMVLMGTPGIGKTSSAEALALDMGWGIVEMNASDQRTGDAIRDVALRASYFNTFDDSGNFMSVKDGGRKLVVLDEADCLYGNSDRGAMPVINELIRNAMQPVILIVNDFYELSRKSAAVKSDTLQVTFRKPSDSAVQNVLAHICAEEGAQVDAAALAKIAANANGDMRAAIRDLESLVYGYTAVTASQASVLNERAVRKDMYALMDAIFRKRDPNLAFSIYNDVNEDPKTVLLWLEENMPYECRTTSDLVRCYERLARADVYLGRVSKRQYYGFWSYARDLMTAGIIEAIHSKKVSYDRFRFPMYLSKMSRSKSTRATRRSLCQKIGDVTHNSASRVQNDCYEFYSTMAAADPEFRIMLVKEAKLEPEELGFLIGQKMDSRIVKETFEAAFPPAPPKTQTKKTVKKGPVELDFVPHEDAPKIEASEPVNVPESLPEQVVPTGNEVPSAGETKPSEPPPQKKTQRSLFDF